MTVETTALLSVQLARKSREAEDICALELRPLPGQSLPRFEAGAHLDLHLPNGLVRQYSLCNDPAETDRYLLGVLRDPASRGGSAAVHDALAEGQTLSISAPKNHFALVKGAPRTLLLAGGIGITPLLAMAEQLVHEGADFRLHYATRSPARTAFRERLAAPHFAGRVQLHHDDGAPEQRLDIAAALAAAAGPGTQLYVCGPQGFIDAVLATARAAGWDEKNLHREYFGAAAPVHTADEGSFEVQIKSSGRVVTVPAGQSVVQALDAVGVHIVTSCEQGVCGTCLTRVLDGVPDHKDMYLTPEEQAANDQFLPCCSRACSPRLVLDL
jgi:vanillate O-demethylase ferredoxin subunit